MVKYQSFPFIDINFIRQKKTAKFQPQASSLPTAPDDSWPRSLDLQAGIH